LKLVIYISLLLVVFSCKEQKTELLPVKKDKIHRGYTLTGNLSLDVNKIYLLDSLFNKVDSADIKKGVFILKGKVKKSKQFYLQLDQNAKKYAIILENTSYNILLHKNYKMIIGGNLNTKLLNYQYSKKELYEQASIYYNKYTFNDINLKTYLKSIDSLKQIENTNFTNFILENKNNILSKIVLNQTMLSSNSVVALKKQVRKEASNTDFLVHLDKLILKLETQEAQKKILRRKVAPIFSAVNLEGSKSSLKTLMRNKKVFLIDFWASWCPPCRESSPKLIRLYEKYRKKGFDILTVSEDRSVADWKNGVLVDEIERWHHVYDDFNRISSLYGVTSLPHLVLIDENGKIIKNKISIKNLEKELKTIFDE